jgi:ankyrin repeat protein
MSNLISSTCQNSRSLFDAINEGDLEAMMRMLEEGASKDEVDSSGRTPIYAAAKKGLLEMVQQLMIRGADKDMGANDGRTPLYIATCYDHFEVM